MTTRLDLVAHGASEATRAARFPDGGEAIEPSSVLALEALRGRLGRYDRVWIAPARTARETAAALGFEADVDPWLRDADYGRWRGLTLKDVAAREPEAFADWGRNPSAAPHGGESLTELIERTRDWLARCLKQDGAALAVSHGSLIRAAIVSVLGADAAAFWRIDAAPLTLARLSGREGRWNLVALSPLGALS
jgi:broad specificity phosphatase PhoE